MCRPNKSRCAVARENGRARCVIARSAFEISRVWNIRNCLPREVRAVREQAHAHTYAEVMHGAIRSTLKILKESVVWHRFRVATPDRNVLTWSRLWDFQLAGVAARSCAALRSRWVIKRPLPVVEDTLTYSLCQNSSRRPVRLRWPCFHKLVARVYVCDGSCNSCVSSQSLPICGPVQSRTQTQVHALCLMKT